jgi:hypothetical protein
VRAIVVSAQPALALTIGTQLPGCDAHQVSSIDAVIDLTDDDAVVVLDLGGSEEASRWLGALRDAGVAGGVVVVDDVPSEALDDATVHLPRPFSFQALSEAFVSLAPTFMPTSPDRFGSEDDEAAGSGRPASPPEGPEADEAAGPLEPDATPPPPLNVQRRHETPPTARGVVEPSADIGDRSDRSDERASPAWSATGEPLPPVPRSAPGPTGGPGETDRRRLLPRLQRPQRGEQAQRTPPPGEGVAPSIQERVAAGRSAARALEQVVAEVPVVVDVDLCAKVLLDEVCEHLQVGAAAIALRVLGADMEVVASTSPQVGAAGHLVLDHPFVRAVVRQGGGLLLAPTDSVRGLLAGVPLSHWPVLLGVTLPEGDEVEGVVLVGHSEPEDPSELDRLFPIVREGADLLLLAASLARLPRPTLPEARLPRSWER